MRFGNGTTSNRAPDLTGQTCVITGATSGLGKAVALALGRLNAGLVLVGRNERAGAALARALRRRSSSARIEDVRADLSRQSEVRALAESIAGTYRAVDVLINNAGARDADGETPDGIELTFATNHLGHFLLMPPGRAAGGGGPPARVITVSSSTCERHGRGPMVFEPSDVRPPARDAKSKLANVMFAYELSRTSDEHGGDRMPSIRNRGDELRTQQRRSELGAASMAHGLRRELISPRNGARPLVHLAVSNGLAGVTGSTFDATSRWTRLPPRERPQARRLWELSVSLTGLTRLPVAHTVPDLVDPSCDRRDEHQ